MYTRKPLISDNFPDLFIINTGSDVRVKLSDFTIYQSGHDRRSPSNDLIHLFLLFTRPCNTGQTAQVSLNISIGVTGVRGGATGVEHRGNVPERGRSFWLVSRGALPSLSDANGGHIDMLINRTKPHKLTLRDSRVNTLHFILVTHIQGNNSQLIYSTLAELIRLKTQTRP